MSACDAVDSVLVKNGFQTMPSARRRIIVDRVSQSRGLPGMAVTVNTQALAAYLRDFAGRNAHLIGIRLVTSVKLAAHVATTTNTPHAMRGCIYNFRLQGQDGHVYTNDVDGRALVFDGWARAGRIINTPPLAPDYNPDVANPFLPGQLLYPVPSTDNVFAIDVDADPAAARVRDISIDIPLIGAGDMAGIVPLADVLNNNGQLTFKLRKELPMPAGAGAAIAAYQVQGQEQIAIRVEFDVLYIDGLMTSRRSLLDDYTMTVVDGPYKYPGFRHRYIAHRWREEDIGDTSGAYGALTNADKIDNFKVNIGATAEIPGLESTELRDWMRQKLLEYPNGEINTWDRQSALPAFIVQDPSLSSGQQNDASDYLTRMVQFAVPYAARAANRPAGAFTYNMAPSGLPSGGLLRVIHSVEGELSDAPLKSARDCGCTAPSGSVLKVAKDARGNELLTHARQ